jgi:hypothetical protein
MESLATHWRQSASSESHRQQAACLVRDELVAVTRRLCQIAADAGLTGMESLAARLSPVTS